MLELICRIPDHIGWMITGMVMMLTAIGCVHFGKFVYRVIQEWKEAEAEEVIFDDVPGSPENFRIGVDN